MRPKIKRTYRIALPPGTQIPTRAKLPKTVYPYWQWLKIPASGLLECRCLSTGLLTLHSHYVFDHSLPCLLDATGECELCRDWKRELGAYAVVCVGVRQANNVIRLPAGVLLDHRGLAERQDLAGRMLRLRRPSGNRTGRVELVIRTDNVLALAPSEVVSPDYLQAWLWNYWGVEVDHQGQEPGGAPGATKNGGEDIPYPAAEEDPAP